MQYIKYAKICNSKYAKYAEICEQKNKQIICNNMHRPTIMILRGNMKKYAYNMHKICKMCKHEIYLQNVQKFALPTLMMKLTCHERDRQAPSRLKQGLAFKLTQHCPSR